jgi:hypothetical protein
MLGARRAISRPVQKRRMNDDTPVQKRRMNAVQA